MPQHVSVTCDTCAANLTSTGNSIGWRLALLNQQMPSRGGVVTDMMLYPALDSDSYFCGERCLVEWVRTKFPEARK